MTAAATLGPPRPQPWLRKHLFADAPLVAMQASLLVSGHVAGALAATSVLLGIHAWASMHPHSQWYLRTHYRLPTELGVCALTFDDGPHHEHTPRLLDLLAQHRQRATFFVIGEHARHQGPLLRRIQAEGHAIGLHSLRHSRLFNVMTQARICDDLNACAAIIADATGMPPPRLFRPPIGLRSPMVADAVHALDLVCTMWTRRAFDTRGRSAARIANDLRRSIRTGSILLCHDGHEPGRPADRSATVAALGEVLPHLPHPSVALRAGDGDSLGIAAP